MRGHLLSALLLASLPLQAQHHAATIDEKKLGKVEFVTSCAPAVKDRFNRAVALLHSFAFDQARKAFEEVAAADPACGMAHWGVSMVALGNPFVRGAIPPARLAEGLVSAEKAVALASRQTPREREFAEAALALYRDAATKNHLARLDAHAEAMRMAHEHNPDDAEAALFYARALIASAPQEDLTYAKLKQASALLEPLFRKMGKHPGLAHYIIHANDVPSLAANALDAARRYADIAPDAPHALHMPSHTFTRLGYWDESIETNIKSADLSADAFNAVHATDYMVYAYLQQGRDASAEAAVSRIRQKAAAEMQTGPPYNFVAMQARLPLERALWSEAARLPVPVGALPYVEGITRFARAIGAARSAQPALARAEVAALAGLVARLKSHNETYWATIVEAQRLAAAAWLARAEKRDSEALLLAKRAADLEATVEKHVVTPGPLLPARELEADLLLDLGKPAEAQRAYEQTLQTEPRRARALYGVARAAELHGDDATARKRYLEMLEVMKRADADRLEPKRARAFLSRS